ncbi:MAG: hypothetical protein HC821_01720 [Lewinella sp.]|nr:hypothetical protein [Lewinella sp.]
MRPIYILLVLCLLAAALVAQPSNDNCSGAITLTTSFQACDSVGRVVLTGTNIGALVVQNSTVFNQCAPTGIGSTSETFRDVWYRFVATNNTARIRLSSATLAGLQLVVYEGSSCLSRQAIRCGVGSGSLDVALATEPGLQYFIRIAGADADDQGTFELDFSYAEDCSPCFAADNGALSVSPLSTAGNYVCGSVVEMCFTMSSWDSTGSNEWLHSVVPVFGPGWDLTTLQPTQVPMGCSASGNWQWFPSGWQGCASGRNFPFGFAFDSAAGLGPACPGTANDGNPGNNWGDGGGACTTIPAPLTFCWTIAVRQCPPASTTFTGEDLSVVVFPYSDGESGSWTQSVCAADTSFRVLAAVVVCDDLPPLVSATAPTCFGASDGALNFAANGGQSNARTFDFLVRNDRGDLIFQCQACPSPQQVTGLPSGQYTLETYTELTNCTRFSQIDLLGPPQPQARAEFTAVCPGQPLPLRGSISPAGAELLQWQGPNGFQSTLPNPMVSDTGQYILNGSLNGCPTVADTVNAQFFDFYPQLVASDTTPCINSPVMLTADPGGNTYRWVNLRSGQTVGGDNPTYSFIASDTTDFQLLRSSPQGCRDTQEITIFVLPRPVISIERMGLLCVGSPVVLTGSGAGVGGTYNWEGPVNSSNNSSISFTPTAPGTYNFTLTGTDANTCNNPGFANISVSAAPTARITASPTQFCGAGGSVTLLAAGGSSFVWDDGSTNPLRSAQVSADTTFTLSALNNNGCPNTVSLRIPVLPILPPPVLSCGPADNDRTTFIWRRDSLASFYQLSVNGMPVGTTTDTFYTVTGLPLGGSVTLSVRAFSAVNCGGASSSLLCSATPCDQVFITLDSIGPFCLPDQGPPRLLVANVMSNLPPDTIFWTGPGVSNIGSDFFFSPTLAGPGQHVLTFNFDDGLCITRRTLGVTVSPRPTAVFTVNPNPVLS